MNKSILLKVVFNNKTRLTEDINRIMKGYKPKSEHIICLILKDILYTKSIILLSTKRKSLLFPNILILGFVAMAFFLIEDWLTGIKKFVKNY